jgi:hypothetical protein
MGKSRVIKRPGSALRLGRHTTNLIIRFAWDLDAVSHFRLQLRCFGI